MAAIDKTYISDWNLFDQIRNWAKDQKIPIKPKGFVNLIDFFYYPDLIKEEWDTLHKEQIEYAERHYNTPEHTKQCKELYGENWEFNPENYFSIVLWNTPTYVDVWLIRNCPFDFVQSRLKEQYGGGWSKQAFTDHNDDDMYQQIKEYRSIYDTYQRNGLGKKAKITIVPIFGSSIRDKKLDWWINIITPNYWWYSDRYDYWSPEEELFPTNMNCCIKSGTLTKKNILNLIKKWNLPKGTKLLFEADYQRYIMYKFYVIVK